VGVVVNLISRKGIAEVILAGLVEIIFALTEGPPCKTGMKYFLLLTIHSSADFTSLYGVLYLRFLQQQLKVGGVLALFTLSLCLPFKVAIFFLLLIFI
jgi:hypothetical protein